MLPSWYKKAACAGKDTEMFFDEKYLNNYREVESICSGCPVRRQCFTRGVVNKESGAWAGIYLNEGQIDLDMNKHRPPESWNSLLTALTHIRRVV